MACLLWYLPHVLLLLLGHTTTTTLRQVVRHVLLLGTDQPLGWCWYAIVVVHHNVYTQPELLCDLAGMA